MLELSLKRVKDQAEINEKLASQQPISGNTGGPKRVTFTEDGAISEPLE